MAQVPPGSSVKPGRLGDTVYWRHPSAGYPFIESSGYSSNTERQVTEALANALADPVVLRRSVPIARLFPAPPPSHKAPTIREILSVDRMYPGNVGIVPGNMGQDSGGALSGTSTPSQNYAW